MNERLKKLVKYTTILISVVIVLTGCSKDGVTTVHIQQAQELCANNGDVKSITNADYWGDSESCGYRCTKATGKTVYRADVSCNNGSKFSMYIIK